jgi:hypothetical protein
MSAWLNPWAFRSSRVQLTRSPNVSYEGKIKAVDVVRGRVRREMVLLSLSLSRAELT